MLRQRGALDTRVIHRRQLLSGGSRSRSFGPMNQIQNPLLNRRLADRLQLKESAPIPTVATELQPVVIVDDLTKAENPETGIEAAMFGGIGAAAGQTNVAQLFNRVGSNRLIKPRWIKVSHDSATLVSSIFIVLSITEEAGSANVGTILNPSTTAPPNLGPRASASTFYGARVPGYPGGAQLDNYYLPPFTLPAITDCEGIVLPPGYGISVYTFELQRDMETTFRWREEPIRG